MRLLILFLSFAFAPLICHLSAQSAQTTDDLRKQIEELKEGQRRIRQDLEEIRRLLTARRPSSRPVGPQVEGVAFDLTGRRVAGSDQARLILIEFTDYQCPYCGRHYRETWPRLEAEYVRSGLLGHMVIDLPLAIHKNAFAAAQAVRCAGEQGRYWDMHAQLFGHQRYLTSLGFHAQVLGLNLERFEGCLEGEESARGVRLDMETARNLGIHSTPGFVLALRSSENPNQAKGLSFIRGARSYQDFKTVIDAALSDLDTSSKSSR